MRRIIGALGFLMVMPLGVRAQELAGSPARATATPASERIRAMQSGLRNLVTLQEKYWSQHGSYTTDMSSLGTYVPGAALPRDSVWVQVIFAGSRGWTGMATHRGTKANCVVFIGVADELPKLPQTRIEKKAPISDGVPICDSDSP